MRLTGLVDVQCVIYNVVKRWFRVNGCGPPIRRHCRHRLGTRIVLAVLAAFCQDYAAPVAAKASPVPTIQSGSECLIPARREFSTGRRYA